MKDGDLFAESPDFVGLRSVYRGCVAYGTIHPSCGLGFPTAQIHVSRNRNSTSQRIAKWAVFMGLCECSEVIHSHLASCHSQIFSDLTTAALPNPCMALPVRPRAPKKAPVPPTIAKFCVPAGGPGGDGPPKFSPLVMIVPTGVSSVCRMSYV